MLFDSVETDSLLLQTNLVKTLDALEKTSTSAMLPGIPAWQRCRLSGDTVLTAPKFARYPCRAPVKTTCRGSPRYRVLSLSVAAVPPALSARPVVLKFLASYGKKPSRPTRSFLHFETRGVTLHTSKSNFYTHLQIIPIQPENYRCDKILLNTCHLLITVLKLLNT